jgi:pimeloyl-ACP methyl ester carboxylesterase
LLIRRSLNLATALWFGLAPVLAWAQADYAREQRWAEEIVPGLLVGDAVRLTSSGRTFLGIYASSRATAPGVIVVHGRGMHPDWSLINVLRSQLADQGYATLSIQMPVLAADSPFERYATLFPEAAERLAAAVRYLREQGHAKVAIVSHSMGARMADYFLGQSAKSGVNAWVAIGILGGYTGTERLQLPTLDIYGERDWPEVRDNAAARAEQLRLARGSAQVEVPAADHFFSGQEAVLVGYVKRFLDQRVR